MKNNDVYKFEALILTPVIGCAILFGVWLSINAALMNYRLARSIDQILYIASIAKDFSADPRLSLDIATNKFIDRLTEWGLPIQATPNGKNRVVITPWNEPMVFIYSPKMKLMRMETTLSSPACKKLLSFLSHSPSEIGLMRVDANELESNTPWKKVYQAEDNKDAISQSLINVSCGRSKQIMIGLNFKTR